MKFHFFPLFLSTMLLIPTSARELRLERNEVSGTIKVFDGSRKEALVTQHARPDFRPYLHPILAPDGKGILTEYQPGHHKHQTGLYWGITRLNGRDYFHHPEGGYWKRNSFRTIKDKGPTVSWETVYHLLDEKGQSVLAETQQWEMKASDKQYILDLTWNGLAIKEITIGKYNYGGLFLRMPWRKGIEGAAVNAEGHRNQQAEGKRSSWVDVGLKVDGREDFAHIAILDHPKNTDYPQPWRVDHQLGVGPVRARFGDWKIEKGKTETIRHRILVYTGPLNESLINEQKKAISEGSK